MLLHESSPTSYFALALSQAPSHYFGSVCLLSSQMHLSAYTFTDTLIVSLHSLHFHICLGPGRKLALIKMYPRLLSHLKHVSPSHDASEHAYHTYIWSVIGFNYFSRIGAHVTNQWRPFLSGDERIIFIHPSLLAFPFELSMGFFSKLAHTKLSPIDVLNHIKASIPLVFIFVFYF